MAGHALFRTGIVEDKDFPEGTGLMASKYGVWDQTTEP
jgi:hypothetical protein